MSQRNGDKARFNRMRRRKILLRRNLREFTKATLGEKPLGDNTEVRKQSVSENSPAV